MRATLRSRLERLGRRAPSAASARSFTVLLYTPGAPCIPLADAVQGQPPGAVVLLPDNGRGDAGDALPFGIETGDVLSLSDRHIIKER